ncbi:Protein kinase-like domain-containing protein [Cynara cardunculus var. scolymus]|uniref:Protein kinase-like domain-containing protein n=1 Tax=Cynara cardunculus var. scolymus TaxID=59895 RepID=A0A103XQI3_CYNCS|nr:Protein kinase-like domain-containing protein [Cynara cardunculus var. scolymus]
MGPPLGFQDTKLSFNSQHIMMDLKLIEIIKVDIKRRIQHRKVVICESGSPDQESVVSGTKKSSISSGGRVREEFLHRFCDSQILTANLEDWFQSLAENSYDFDVPFELIDLQKFDYALEGVSFQQLIRMPSAGYASPSGTMEATAFLAIEDFLHASVKGLWEAFWNQDEPMPLSVACLYDANLKFYQAEKAIANGKLGGLCATAVMLNNPRHPHGKWHDILELALLRPVTPFDRIWNKLGNANWGDIGALQVLFATFHSMVQYAGMPNNSIEDLAADHSSRLQSRRNERRLGEIGINGNGLFKLQQRSISPEIVEIQEEPVIIEPRRSIKLEVGSILLVEDSNWQKSYQINQVLSDGEMPYYVASSVDDPGKALFLYVGSHPSQLEPAWEDMKLWYQVQRQTKVFSVMKHNGLSSKYLPELVISGRIVHPGQCRKPNSGGNCDNPWCGTPILVTTPVGKTVAEMVNLGQFGPDEAIRCCQDCLSALSTAASAGIRHGDIRPENIICVTSGVIPQPYFVLVGWGHAILEERDRPAMNLHFSSTYALQEGKLCSASDAESLVYLLYFSSGGDLPDLDSVEGALEWRDTFWSKRLIQQKLGEISAVLKAFADYVDSLCGTPYPMNYEIWLRRLKRHLHENGKEINPSS